MRRRGFFAAVGGVLAGLGLGRSTSAAPARELTEDDWLAELNRQVTAMYGVVAGGARTAQEQEDQTRAAYASVATGLQASTAMLIVPQMQQVVARFPLLYEYWRWLAAPIYRPADQLLTVSIHPLSFTPDRLRDADLQRTFIRWRIFNQT